MITLFIVIAQIFIKPLSGVKGTLIAVEIHILIFDASPQAFYKDIVIGPPPMIHADSRTGVQKKAGILGACEMAALVTVHDFRMA